MTSYTKRRTYSSEAWHEAETAWERGDFSGEWIEWRKLAAESGGIITAPTGTRWDSWTDDEPSQRAILIRAIRETPELLRFAIRAKGAPSWAKVIALVVRERDELRADVRRDERADETRRSDEPDSRQATYALGEIIRILGDSAR